MSLSLRKSRIGFLFELLNLHLHVLILRLIISHQSTDNLFPRNRFILMSASEKISFL